MAEPASDAAAEVVLISEPAGARVLEGRRHLGTTPLTLAPPEEGPRRLTLRLRGWAEAEVVLRPTDRGRRVVRLSRDPEPPRARERDRAAAPPAVAPAVAPQNVKKPYDIHYF